MNNNEYEVTLTNGTVLNKYRCYASSVDEALILAQATAIKESRGYFKVRVQLMGSNKTMVGCVDLSK